MENEQTLNMLGALALSLMDGLQASLGSSAGGGETPAALVTLGVEPGTLD